MRVFIVTIPFTVERRVFSSLLTRHFVEGDEIVVWPANNVSDSAGLYWLDSHCHNGEETTFDDCYGHLLDTNDLEAHCMEM